MYRLRAPTGCWAQLRAGATGERHGKDSQGALLLRIAAAYCLKALGKILFPKAAVDPRGGRCSGKAQVQRHFPTERLLTDHGAVDDVELVAVQQGLAADLLQLLIAAVMRQAAPGGQTRGGEGLYRGWALGSQLEDRGGEDSPASSPGREGVGSREVNE